MSTEDISQIITEEVPGEVDNDSENVANSEKYEGYVAEEKYFSTRKITELARFSWREGHYLRGVQWAPDGTCCLLTVADDGMHILDLQKDSWNLKNSEEEGVERHVCVMDSAVHVKDAGTVYDTAWFPGMNSGYPDTCCWAATRKHEPIQMWDAFDGKLRCSYRGFNELDEMDTAISVEFSPDASKLYGGYKKSFKIFNTAIPGNDCTSYKTKFSTSCMATTYTNPYFVALGSWNGKISTFDTRTPQIYQHEPNSGVGHKGGITHMKVTPSGQHLISGTRKEDKMFAWDLRFMETPMRTFEREVKTNQRIYFDVSKEGNWLVSGDTDGYIHVWNLIDESATRISFPVHHDGCNGISLHPHYPIIATSSGQYHPEDEDIDETDAPVKIENSVVFWKLGCIE